MKDNVDRLHMLSFLFLMLRWICLFLLVVNFASIEIDLFLILIV